MQRPDKDLIDYENERIADCWQMITAMAKDYSINSDDLRYIILKLDDGGEE